jgi:hypothetical protein
VGRGVSGSAWAQDSTSLPFTLHRSPLLAGQICPGFLMLLYLIAVTLGDYFAFSHTGVRVRNCILGTRPVELI